MGLEHQVKLADAGEVLLAAYRAYDVVLGNVLFKFFVRPAVAGLGTLGEVLDQLVGTEARLARLAVHQRVVEAAHMAGRNPNLAVHQYRAVQTRVVGAFLNELLPPRLLDVVFVLHAQRAEVPSVGQTAVNFGAGEYKAAVFAQRNQLVHGKLCHSNHPPHKNNPRPLTKGRGLPRGSTLFDGRRRPP